jgi:hypothetical protein
MDDFPDRLLNQSAKKLALLSHSTPITLSLGGRFRLGNGPDLAFSPDGQHLAVGGGYKGKGEIKVWDRSLWDNRADGPEGVFKGNGLVTETLVTAGGAYRDFFGAEINDPGTVAISADLTAGARSSWRPATARSRRSWIRRALTAKSSAAAR